MKSILRALLINGFSLWLLSHFIPGFLFTGDFKNLVVGAVLLSLINFFLGPLFKLLLIPINILTLQLFSWLTNAIALYVLTLLAPQFSFHPWNFSGLEYAGFTIPTVQLTYFYTLILCGFVLSLITRLLRWIAK